MTTKQQTEANRINAQRSTGPRTTEGKAASSQNAVRHGLLAQNPVLATEDPDHYDAFRDLLTDSLAPVGVHEAMLADEIVSLSWRLRRATTIEAGLLTGGIAAIDERYYRGAAGDLAMTEIQQNKRFEDMRHGITDDIIEVIDEIKYEELLGSADAAAEIQRNDQVRLAQAFADVATTSDSVLKLQRYESAIFRRRNDLRQALGSLQRVRMNAELAGAEPSPEDASSA